MTVLEIMERTNTTVSSKRIQAYVQDSLNEIQAKSGDQVSREFLNVEADVRYYNLPTSKVKITGVFAKSNLDNTKWARIPRVQAVDMLESSGESTATSDANIIVI